MSKTDTEARKPNASALRQLISSIYDGLLLMAVLLIAVAITVPLTQAGLIAPNSPLLSLYLLTICFLFYASFWVHGGQTLGMHVWHIRIEQMNGSAITWKQALIRFVSGLPAWGILVLGLIRLSVPEQIQTNYFSDWIIALNPVWLLIIACVWLVIDHQENSWRDKLSGTHIVVMKK